MKKKKKTGGISHQQTNKQQTKLDMIANTFTTTVKLKIVL